MFSKNFGEVSGFFINCFCCSRHLLEKTIKRKKMKKVSTHPFIEMHTLEYKEKSKYSFAFRIVAFQKKLPVQPRRPRSLSRLRPASTSEIVEDHIGQARGRVRYRDTASELHGENFFVI